MANPYPANFEDADGTVRFSGQVDFTDAGNQPGGGGSQPDGALLSKEFRLTEQTTGGVYAGALAVEEGTIVYDVELWDLSGSRWQSDDDDDAQLLQIGDGDDPEGFLSPSQCFVPTQNLGASGTNGGFPGNGAGAMVSTADINLGNFAKALETAWMKRYVAPDEVTVTLTTVVESPPGDAAGDILVKVIYFAPVTTPGEVVFT